LVAKIGQFFFEILTLFNRLMYYYNATPLQQQLQQPQVSAVENHDNLLAIFHAGGDCPFPKQTDRKKQANYCYDS
jgi:hypothetical protein